MFNPTYSPGFACADLADSMDSTAQTWSVNFGCGHHPVEFVPVLAMTIGVSLVPIIFYSLIWKLTD